MEIINGNGILFGEKTFTKLLRILLNEVLKDFQNYLSDMYKVPTAIWVIDPNNKIYALKQRNPSKNFPKFCTMLKQLNTQYRFESCTENDKRLIKQYLNLLNPSKTDIPWTCIECHMKLSRLIFPIVIKNKVIGALVLGKFIRKSNSSMFKHKNKLRKNISSYFLKTITQQQIIKSNLYQYYNFSNVSKSKNIKDKLIKQSELQTLLDEVDSIPSYSDSEINWMANKILKLLPLLKLHISHIYPQDPVYDGLLFLESLDYTRSEIFLTSESLWKKVDNLLESIVTHLKLKSAVVYFSDREDYQDLILQAVRPSYHHALKNIVLDSRKDFQYLTVREKGVVLPVSNGPIEWFNVYLKKIFDSKTAIIYAKHIFAGKLILIGFGFKENIYLSDAEKLILKDSVYRLFKFINNVLTSINLDHIMSETGHMLARAAGDIKQGVTILNAPKTYGGSLKQDEQSEMKEDATLIINGGLTRLDLIIRNYHAFSEFRDSEKSKNKGVNVLKKQIDVFILLETLKESYRSILKSDEKTIRYQGSYKTCSILSKKSTLELIFLNLIDNALKFAYNGTSVDINFIDKGNFFNIQIKNLGVGIAKDELAYVFERYFQSRYTDTDKRREGSGYGLSICKRYMEIYFPTGSININSIAVPSPSGRRFPGDNFLTIVDLILPKNG